MGVGHIGAKRGAASVPAEVEEFVSRMAKGHAPHQSAVSRRVWFDVDHSQLVRLAVVLGVHDGYVSDLFRWSLHRHFGGGVKGLVGYPSCHDIFAPVV
jgi:hypothetical protein